jgi:CHAT domain-containing protein
MKRTPIYWSFLLAILSFIGFFSPISAQSVQRLQTSFDSLRSAGNLKGAIPFAEKIVALLEQQGSMDKTVYTQKLVQLSKAYNHDFRREEAEIISLKALKINPQKDTLHANTLIEWCFAIGGQGQFERADSVAQVALMLNRQLLGENNLPYITALFAAAGMQMQGGRIQEATHSFEQCRYLWDKNKLEIQDIYLQILANLGSCYHASGKLSKAESYLRESIMLRKNHPKLDQIAFLETGTLTNILINRGQYAEADQLIEELQEKMIKAGVFGDAQYSDIFLIKAQLLSFMNKPDEAVAMAKKGRLLIVKDFGPNNPSLYSYDTVIGTALVNAGKTKEAEKIFLAALDSMRILDGEGWVEFSTLKIGLANAYVVAKNYQAGIKVYLESIDYYEKSDDRGYDMVLKDMYLNLSEAYRFVHDYAESRKYLQKFESIAPPDQVSDKLAIYLNAELNFVEKNYSAVVPLLKNYSEDIKRQISDELFLFDDQKRQGQVEDLQFASEGLLILARADAVQKKLLGLNDLILDFELFKKSLLLTTTQKMRESILSGKDENLKQDYAAWIDQKEDLAYYYTQPQEVLLAENIEISRLEAQADSLEKAIARSNTKYYKTTNDLKLNWRAIHSALQPGQAALEIVRFQGQLQTTFDSTHYAIFILTPELPEPALVFIAAGDQLEQVVIEKHLSACSSPQAMVPGDDLYNAVWKQINPYVQNAKSIFVSADGCFHKINFATLRQADNSYLLDRYSFHPVFSLKDILTPPIRTQSLSRNAFLLGNPAFSPPNNSASNSSSRSRSATETVAHTKTYALDNPMDVLRDLRATRGIELSPLPGSQKEVDHLAALLQRNAWQVSLFTGADAKEEEVKSLRSPNVLHLATHGYFLANERAGTAGLSKETVVRNPLLRSMLFFAGAQNTLDKKTLNSKEDGILTAYEVINMNLDSTELVVLSACKTGQGKVQNGEGVYGLQRALRIAGAQSLLLSLWDVDDEVGRTFIQTFYEQWLSGKSKPEAFRYTQLAIKAKYPQPFYWAGFILIGE